MAATAASSAAKESFAALLDESLGTDDSLEGKVLRGTIIAIEGDSAMVDVGLKSEGRVALKEFAEAGQMPELKVGDEVEVYLERMENKNGEAMLSREKAKREEAWTQLAKAFNNNERVTGTIFGRVKGGFTVDLSGAVAFGARKPTLLCPSAVAVHHDRDVIGHARAIDVEQEAHVAVLTNIGTDFMRRSRWYSAKL